MSNKTSFLNLCLGLLALVGVALTTITTAQAQAPKKFSLEWWSQTPLQWDTEPSTFSPQYRLISGHNFYDTSRVYPIGCRDQQSRFTPHFGAFNCMWVGKFYTNKEKIDTYKGVFDPHTLCIYMFHTQGKPEVGYAYFSKDEEDTCEEISQYAPHEVDTRIYHEYERTSECRDLGHRKIKCEQTHANKLESLAFLYSSFIEDYNNIDKLVLESRPEQCQGGGQHQCCQNLRTLDR